MMTILLELSMRYQHGQLMFLDLEWDLGSEKTVKYFRFKQF
jgi:hypothetical protein